MNNIIWNMEHLNGAMAGSRKSCKHQNYFNRNFFNGLLLIVYMMALIFPTHSNTFEKESNNLTCSDSMTCTKCAIKPMCEWSLSQQACKNKNTFKFSSLIVSSIGECPQFSVVQKHDYNSEDSSKINVDYIVEITNDFLGFIDYLEKFRISCVSLKGSEVATEISNKILCQFHKTKSKLNDNEPTVTHFIFIKFNNIMLRFNNVADHYLTVYKHEECVNDEKYKNCVTCGWYTNRYLNYLKWCSSDDTCKDHRNVYMKNNATDKLNEKVAYVTNDCADINVTAVNPLMGPKTGGTTLTILVKNHKIFMENRTLNVTVAGTVCTDPKTSGVGTITCITSKAVGTLSGPVLVEYSSIEGVLKIESSQIFQFYQNLTLDSNHQFSEATVIGKTSTSPSDQSKLPGWSLATIALLFVFALVYFLTKKYWYDVTERIRNSLDTSTSLQELLKKPTEL